MTDNDDLFGFNSQHIKKSSNAHHDISILNNHNTAMFVVIILIM